MRKLFFLLATLFLISGCSFSGGSFDELNRSSSGLLIEEMLPTDTWFLADFVTLDNTQRDNFDHFMAQFSDDSSAFLDELIANIDENLKSVDLSYIEDVAPILGDEGMRFVVAMSDKDGTEVTTHAALTLHDPAKGLELLATLEQEGRFVKVTQNDYDLYMNVEAAESSEEVYYFALQGDIFAIADDSEELAEMLDLGKSEGAESLWTTEKYQEVIAELPANHVASIYMDSAFIAQNSDPFGAAALAGNTMSYLRGQGAGFVATDKGIEFEGIALGDEAKIDLDDTSLDELQARSSYLTKSMPGDYLGVYLEAYDLSASLENQYAADPRVGAILQFLGVTSLEELEGFLGEGYSLAFHNNSAFMPGLTLLFDVSADVDAADRFIMQLDLQVNNLLGLFEYQDNDMANVFTQSVAEVKGGDFNMLTLDLDALMAIYDPDGTFVLPDPLQGQFAKLIYGMTNDKRMVVSTYEGWLEDSGATLKQMDDFKETTRYLGNVKEGLVYVDFSEVMTFAEAFQDFRDTLREEADAILAEEAAEEAAEGEDEEMVAPVIEEVPEGIDWVAVLSPLKSFAFSSDATDYKVRLRGVLLLED